MWCPICDKVELERKKEPIILGEETDRMNLELADMTKYVLTGIGVLLVVALSIAAFHRVKD